MANLDYLLTAQLHDGREVTLDPDSKGWADKKVLSETKVWSLVPREHNGLPVITVSVPEKGKPVYKSRIYGKGLPGTGGPSFRAYAIGYKLGRTTHWVWVMPGGNIEFGEEPVYADLILKRMAGLV
jgi:hypothetical protein